MNPCQSSDVLKVDYTGVWSPVIDQMCKCVLVLNEVMTMCEITILCAYGCPCLNMAALV